MEVESGRQDLAKILSEPVLRKGLIQVDILLEPVLREIY